MKRLVYSAGFTLFVTALVAYALWDTQHFARSGARLFPRIITIPTLLVCMLVLLNDVRRAVLRLDPPEILDLAFESDLEESAVGRRVAIAFAWFGGLWLGTVLFGFQAAIVMFVPAYLLVEGRVRWYWAFAGLGAVWVVIVLVLGGMLGTEVPAGRFGWS